MHRIDCLIAALVGASLLAAAAPTLADVKLPAIFGDNMVLQGDMKVPVGGLGITDCGRPELLAWHFGLGTGSPLPTPGSAGTMSASHQTVARASLNRRAARPSLARIHEWTVSDTLFLPPP